MRLAVRCAMVSLAFVAGGVACGGDEVTRQASGPPMTPQAAKPGAAASKNRPPKIDRVVFVPARPAGGGTVEAKASATDPDGDPIRFGYLWAINGRSLSAGGAQITLPAAGKGDRLTVTVTASDGRAESAPVQVETQLGNRPPKLHAVRLDPPGGIVGGSEVTAIPIGEDLDGDGMHFRYTWRVNGQLVDETGPVLSTEGLRRGDTIQVRVVAWDDESSSNAIETPPLKLANAKPRVRTVPVESAEGALFVYQVHAEDPDGDQPRFRLIEGPEGMTISATRGEIEWRPTPAQAGDHTVKVEVDDLQGGKVVISFQVGVEYPEANEEPGDTPPPAAPAR